VKSRKIQQNPYFGGLRSFNVIGVGNLVPQERSSSVLVMIRSKSVSICNRSDELIAVK